MTLIMIKVIKFQSRIIAKHQGDKIKITEKLYNYFEAESDEENGNV